MCVFYCVSFRSHTSDDSRADGAIVDPPAMSLAVDATTSGATSAVRHTLGRIDHVK